MAGALEFRLATANTKPTPMASYRNVTLKYRLPLGEHVVGATMRASDDEPSHRAPSFIVASGRWVDPKKWMILKVYSYAKPAKGRGFGARDACSVSCGYWLIRPEHRKIMQFAGSRTTEQMLNELIGYRTISLAHLVGADNSSTTHSAFAPLPFTILSHAQILSLLAAFEHSDRVHDETASWVLSTQNSASCAVFIPSHFDQSQNPSDSVGHSQNQDTVSFSLFVHPIAHAADEDHYITHVSGCLPALTHILPTVFTPHLHYSMHTDEWIKYDSTPHNPHIASGEGNQSTVPYSHMDHLVHPLYSCHKPYNRRHYSHHSHGKGGHVGDLSHMLLSAASIHYGESGFMDHLKNSTAGSWLGYCLRVTHSRRSRVSPEYRRGDTATRVIGIEYRLGSEKLGQKVISSASQPIE